MELSKEIKTILKANANLHYDEALNKIKCSISGHEMPCNVDQIQLYLNGKKFKKLKDTQDKAFGKYKPHIVPNIKEGQEHQLFCLLTKRNINKSIEHVERHVNGAKYKKALSKWEAKKDVENSKEAEEEKCVIEEDDEEEDEDEEGQDDLDDLYPGNEDGSDDDDDDDVNEDSDAENRSKHSNPVKNKPSTSKRKSNSADSGSEVKRKKQKKKKPK